MTDKNSSSSRRVVIPESLMAYLQQYGQRFSCDDLSAVVIRVIQDHEMLNISTTLGIVPGTAPSMPQAIAPPAEVPTETKKPRFTI